ncbi:hypothetical protein EDD86DRAFT_195201 [Gorgonomyces haynaldii]|nr:hypothetical protein EDD86DRAFT_195201 [Gorgonomyces haynaldii]
MRKRKEKQELIWCWYCDKEFQDERTLVQHQRLRHFKCSECPRKLLSGPGLRQHMMQVHKQSLEKHFG